MKPCLVDNCSSTNTRSRCQFRKENTAGGLDKGTGGWRSSDVQILILQEVSKAWKPSRVSHYYVQCTILWLLMQSVAQCRVQAHEDTT